MLYYRKLHPFNPIIYMCPYIQIFSKTIPTYGICLVAGILLVWLLSLKSAKKYKISCYDLLIVSAFALLFALPFGSILYTIVTYNIKEILFFISEGNFQAFGGLVYYGAFLGGTIGACIGIKVAGLKIATTEKIIIPYIPLGHAVGRIGCLLAGCCHGIEYTGPFAIYYPNSILNLPPAQGYLPIQIIEAVFNIIICIILIRFKNILQKRFELLSLYFLVYGCMRFLLEFFRGDENRGITLHFSTSQWISMVLIMVGTLYLLIPKIQNTYKQVSYKK